MYRATTRGIEITVEPAFMAEQSAPQDRRYFWSYRIEIANRGTETVILRSRYWKITDGNGQIREVRGEGVIGEQPMIAPGAIYTYTSGCPLETPQGIMVGSYIMETTAGDLFAADIPAFSLDMPEMQRVLH